MKNIGINRLENVNVDKFTNTCKMKIRRALFPLTRFIVKANTKLNSSMDIVVDNRPELDKDEQYIFTSTHYYTEDIGAAIGTLDRNAWVLMETKNQIENNNKMYGAWLNGIIYINRKDEKSRKESLEKMSHILNNGSSMLIFPEGGLNNKENEICMNIFDETYYLSTNCDKKVVPMASIRSEKDNKIHVLYGEPLDLSEYKVDYRDSAYLKETKKLAACSIIRDSMASLKYELMEKYNEPLKRSELPEDIHRYYQDIRLNEYMRTKWNDEETLKNELIEFKPKVYINSSEAIENIKRVNLYERNIKNILNECISDYGLSYIEASQIFGILKFAKDPEEANELITKFKETVCSNEVYNKIQLLETNRVEPYIKSCEIKRKEYPEDVWRFTNNVHLGLDNASSIAKIVTEEKTKEENNKSFENYIDNNYQLMKLMKKGKNNKR